MKLLVCDDDISTIDVIQSQLDCRQLGISTILRAYNGVMARQVIDKENPELILCDIGMPLSNGIEVLEYAYNKNPAIEFSFLTCYEKFEYAQIAIKYGVTSYLTKPFDLDEVRVCIQKMIANAEKKRINTNAQPQNVNDALMSSVFRQAADGVLGSDPNAVNAGLKVNGMNFDAYSVWRIVLSCADMTDAILSTWSKELLLFTASRISDEVLTDYVGSAHTVVNADDRFVWSTCFIKGEIDDETLYDKCQQLVDFCHRHMSLVPVVLISKPFEFYNASEVSRCLMEQMRKLRFFAGRILMEGETADVAEDSEVTLNENRILWYLKKRDSAGYDEYMSSVIERLPQSQMAYSQFRTELANIYMTHFRDNGMNTSDIFMDPHITELDEKSSVCHKDLLKYSQLLFDLQQSRLQEIIDSEDIIARAKRYIDDNYHENIDRNDVAAVAFVTPNYLSKLFKSSMNMNLREYINQLRIEEAKRLLLSTSMSVSEIASFVGYYNISYFSTIFHKLVGVSPFDWRNERGGMTNETE